MTPQQVFDAKWPSVQTICQFRAKKYRLSHEDAEDVAQFAGARLWQQCQRGIPLERLDCGIIALAGWRNFQIQHEGAAGKKIRATVSLDAPDDNGLSRAGEIPARENGLRLRQGLRYTPTDAGMDAPEQFGMREASLTTLQVSAHLGMTRARVHQLRHRLGGVKIGSRWRFPVTALGYAKKRVAKAARVG